jgi:hypothetical protein
MAPRMRGWRTLRRPEDAEVFAGSQHRRADTRPDRGLERIFCHSCEIDAGYEQAGPRVRPAMITNSTCSSSTAPLKLAGPASQSSRTALVQPAHIEQQQQNSDERLKDVQQNPLRQRPQLE